MIRYIVLLSTFGTWCMLYDFATAEKCALERKLCVVLDAAHKNPGLRNMCLHEVLSVVQKIQAIIENPHEYIARHKKLSKSGYCPIAHVSSPLRCALMLFFEQPLVMVMGDVVDDSFVECLQEPFDDSTLSTKRAAFRKEFMRIFKKIMLS